MHIPPASTIASRRAATLTPSPKISLSSTMTSPRLMPILYRRQREAGISPLRRAMLLNFHSTASRFIYSLEFDQHSVAGSFDDAPFAFGNCRIDQFQPDCLEPGEGAGFIGLRRL